MSTPEIRKKVINKTKNIVSATILVMSVSDSSVSSNHIKERTVQTSLDLLDLIQGVRNLTPVYKNQFQANSYNQIDALLDYLHVGYSVGVVSRMNTDILVKELTSLREMIASINLITSMQNENSHIEIPNTFFNEMIISDEIQNDKTLDEKNNQRQNPNSGIQSKNLNIKDSSGLIATKQISQNKISKGHSLQNKNDSGTQNIQKIEKPKFSTNYISNNEKRQNRKDQILDLITERRLQGKNDGVMVKDILVKINDVSEKTLQRELSALVAKGILRKIGDKRWSRYVLK